MILCINFAKKLLNNLSIMKKYILPAISVLLLGCNNSEDVKPEICPTVVPEPIATTSILDLTQTQRNAVDGYNEYGWTIFSDLLSADPLENHSFSPVSVNSALSILGSLDDDSNGNALAKLFGFSDVAEMNDFNEKLLHYLPAKENGTDLTLANAVWLDKSNTPSVECVENLGKTYGATLQAVDFTDQNTLDIINGWVSHFTNGRIPVIVNRIDPATKLAITNALYLSGEWEQAFYYNADDKILFTNAAGKTDVVEQLYDLRNMEYAEADGFKMVSVPFKGDKVCFDFILPTQGDNLNHADYAALANALTTTEVEFKLPKFKFESDYVDLLFTLLNHEIPARGYYFSDLGFSSLEEFQISQVVHKMSVTVDENGAEAAASTYIGMEATANPDVDIPKPTYKIVNLDKPFYFVVREKAHGIILAIGKVNKL